MKNNGKYRQVYSKIFTLIWFSKHMKCIGIGIIQLSQAHCHDCYI